LPQSSQLEVDYTMAESNSNPKWYLHSASMCNLSCVSFFEISIGGNKQGRILFELFADSVPRTAEKSNPTNLHADELVSAPFVQERRGLEKMENHCITKDLPFIALSRNS
jgi:hypothetical protein